MIFGGYSTLLSLLYTRILNMYSYYYLFVLGSAFVLFLSYRFPYVYSPFFFAVFLSCYIFTCFVCLMLIRLSNSINEFFSKFVPIGTPLYICPLVCCAETISYIIRPFVMIFRPFINLGMGYFVAIGVGGFSLANWW